MGKENFSLSEYRVGPMAPKMRRPATPNGRPSRKIKSSIPTVTETDAYPQGGEAMPLRRRAMFSQDVQSLGGSVFVVPYPVRLGDEPHFRIRHTSAGGDCCWTSQSRFHDEASALAGAEAVAEVTGAEIGR
jgi:hypothetical protein